MRFLNALRLLRLAAELEEPFRVVEQGWISRLGKIIQRPSRAAMSASTSSISAVDNPSLSWPSSSPR